VTSLGQPISGRTDGLESVHLCVPRDFLRQLALPMDRLNGEVVDTSMGRLLAEFMLNLAARMPELEPADYPGLRSSIRAMIEGSIASARLGFAAEVQPVQANLLERARRLVHERLGSPTLGVDELCRDLAVSRSRLYRLFEPLGGVVHYIRQRRLLDAHTALADADDRRPIVAIAAERGFIDPAEFSRAFKREFGYRPSDARSSLQSLPFRQQLTGETLADVLHSLG
jgi:AraC-like DNA-binding protein